MILVAGATGVVGRAVLRLLKAEKRSTRALARDAERVSALLGGLTDETWLADATDPAPLVGACERVDIVFSSLGASVSPSARDSRSYLKVDLVANRNLLAEAKRAGVRRFVYVSVYSTPAYADTAYVRAHEDFVKDLEASGLDYAVLRPTGLFSAFAEMLPMARKGRLPIIAGGGAETNPLAESEFAEVCRDAIFSPDTALERDVGGPEVLTRRQIAALAFEAVDRRPRFVGAPGWMMTAFTTVARPFNPRLAELLAFVAAASTTRCVAEKYGLMRLSKYLRECATVRDQLPIIETTTR
jgi:uncharacterized protein YbjT (DUF2867 family)